MELYCVYPIKQTAWFRWDAWRECQVLKREIQRLTAQSTPSTSLIAPPAEALRADLYETACAFVLRVELPGVSKKDVAITVEGKRVSVEGRPMDEALEARCIRRERPTGALARVVELPEEVDAPGAHARIADGVLHVLLPKKPSQVTRRAITVEGA